MIVKVVKNSDSSGRFWIVPLEGSVSRSFVLRDKEADELLYWYLTEVLGKEHKYGYWELDLDE